MKHKLTLACLMVALGALVIHAAPPPPPDPLVIDCPTKSAGGNCVVGFVSFTGTNYPASVKVEVSHVETGLVIDGSRYHSDNGVLYFTETLELEGAWRVVVTKGRKILTDQTFPIDASATS
jgi:hypothetical protein